MELRHLRGGSFALTAQELISSTSETEESARALLEELAAASALERRTQWRCPHCQRELDEIQCQEDQCPLCNQPFEEDSSCERREIYIRGGRKLRDVTWVLALHGMNTVGRWQERLNWMVAGTYGRAVPVAIYKYGVERPGVLFPWRQRQLMRRLNRQIRDLGGESEEYGFGPRPDVIAHSFGTLLLGNALQSDEKLVVGRVILTGCILRPDYDWSSLISAGRVEAVLNHVGGHDFWARIAHWVIPGSGPAGRRGFDDDSVVNVMSADFGHSDFFLETDESSLMSLAYEKIWRPFLRDENLSPAVLTFRPNTAWKQSWFRVPIWLLVVLLFVGCCVVFSAVLVQGVRALFS